MYCPVIFVNCLTAGVRVPDVSLEQYCSSLVLGVVNEAVDEGFQLAMMFHKGHVSPPWPSCDDGEEESHACESHCILKSYLFDKIDEIDSCENETERIKAYIHACEDLLSAVDEIQERLQTILH